MHYVIVLIVLLAATTARADLIVRLERTGSSVDFPHLTLVNTGPDPLLAFSLSIGNEGMNFDSAVEVFGAEDVGALLVSPDSENGLVRSDVLTLAFMHFDPGLGIALKLDLDGDAGSATVDWQTTLFNNGELPNAIATAQWDNGDSASLTLPDALSRDPLSPYELTLSPVAVPEPHTLALLLSGVLLLSLRVFLPLSR